jgi:hypothetical protein
MLWNQVLVYELKLFTLFNMNISINALFLLLLFFTSFLFRKKSKVIRIINLLAYSFILIGTSNIFVKFTGDYPLIDFRLNGYLFFWHALTSFRLNAFTTYHVVFSFINVMVMLFFPFIIKYKRAFLYTIIFIFLFTILSHLLHISDRTLYLVDYLYYITGFTFAYVILNFKKIVNYIDRYCC